LANIVGESSYYLLTDDDKASQCASFRAMTIFAERTWSPYLQTLNIISWMGFTLSALTCFSNKKLQSHPNLIVGWLMVTLSFANYPSVGKYAICPGNAQWLLAKTWYFDTSKEGQMKALNAILEFNLLFLSFASVFRRCIDACLSVDLWLTLRNPFQKPSSRMYWYAIVSTTFSLVFTALDDIFEVVSWLMLVITLGVYYITMVIGLVYVGRRFNDVSLSKQYRDLIKRRHVYFVILMIFCSTVILCMKFIGAGYKFPFWLEKIMAIYFATSGIMYAAIRMGEPLVW